MKASVLQENLALVLAQVKPFSATKGWMPETRSIRLTADNGHLRVEATDLEKRISTSVGAQIEEEGSICVDASNIREFVATLPDERIDFAVKDGDDGKPVLVIDCGETDASMSGIKGDDFPPVFDTKDGTVIRIDAEEFGKAIRRVVIAVARDDSRPVLTGAHLKVTGGEYTMVGADGFRLALQTGQVIEPTDVEVEAIIPRDTLVSVERILREAQEPVRIEVDERHTKIIIQGSRTYEVVSNNLRGQFPTYTSLVPTEEELVWRMVADTTAVHNAVKSAGIYARESENSIVRFWVEEENDSGMVLRVSATAALMGDAVREVRGVSASGLDDKLAGRIAFNSEFVRDLLSISEGKIEMAGTTPSSPCLWRLVDKDGDDGYCQVIMPMFVDWGK